MGFLDSALGWKSKWFYAKDTPSGSDTPLMNMSRQVVQRASWMNLLTLEEKAETDDLVTRIAELKDAGLSGAQLSGIFLKHRVQPLQARAEPMWAYKTTADPSRVRVDELSGTELDTYMRLIIKPSELTTEVAVPPFSSNNPPPSVSRVI